MLPLIYLPNLGMGASPVGGAVAGPYRTMATEIFVPGAVATEVHQAGQGTYNAAQTFQPGESESEAH